MKRKVRQFLYEPDDLVSSDEINRDIDKILFTKCKWEQFCSYIKSLWLALHLPTRKGRH